MREQTGCGGGYTFFVAQLHIIFFDDPVMLTFSGLLFPPYHFLFFSFPLPFLPPSQVASICNVSNNHCGIVAQAVSKSQKWTVIEEFITKIIWFPDYSGKVKYLSSPKSSRTTVFEVTHFSLFLHSNPDELVSKIKGMSFTSCLHCKGL